MEKLFNFYRPIRIMAMKFVFVLVFSFSLEYLEVFFCLFLIFSVRLLRLG